MIRQHVTRNKGNWAHTCTKLVKDFVCLLLTASTDPFVIELGLNASSNFIKDHCSLNRINVLSADKFLGRN